MSLAAEAAQAVADSARRWGTIAIELADIHAGMRVNWSGLAAFATFARLDDLARRVERAIAEHTQVAEVLSAEGIRLEEAIARGDLVAANDADAALVSLLRTSWEADTVRSMVAGPVAIDASVAPASARGHGAAWHGLSPYERTLWAAKNPELSDGAGLPATSRDGLNRIELARALGDPREDGDGKTHRRMTAAARYLASDAEARLLGLRPDGRGVVASGDPAAAAHVVTLVPGTGASMESVGRSAQRAEAVCAELDGAGGAGEGSGCVAVAWMDYEAPETIPDAAMNRALAEDAAPRLREFHEGLRAMSDGQLNAVGYSYGAVALGLAAGDEGLAADELAFVAAPGAGVERAGDLTLRDGVGGAAAGGPDSVFALASRWDPIPWWAVTSTFGPDPVGEDFGGSAARLDEWIGHSDYFEPGSVPMAEIGRALGR